MITGAVGFSGSLRIVLKGKSGDIKDEREVRNLVVDSGLAYIASCMVGESKTAMSHMAVGTGDAAPTPEQVGLVASLGSPKTVLSASVIDGNKVRYECCFDEIDTTGSITEAGIFNASVDGDMLCRTTFPAVHKASDDSMTVTWTIVLSAK